MSELYELFTPRNTAGMATMIIFLMALPTTFILARVMVLVFRLAVKRAMARRAGVNLLQQSIERPVSELVAQRLAVTDDATPSTPLARDLLDTAMRSPARTAMAYSLGGVAAALLLGFIPPPQVPVDTSLTVRSYLLYFFGSTWAIVPAVFIIAVPRRRIRVVALLLTGLLYAGAAKLLGADSGIQWNHFMPTLCASPTFRPV
jgi:hypothetical protein